MKNKTLGTPLPPRERLREGFAFHLQQPVPANS
jgi:hypothetical protein